MKLSPHQIEPAQFNRAIAARQFHRARRQAAMEALVARLSGQSADLLSYEDIVAKLGVQGQAAVGVRQIPVSAIVGSVGRYQDFTRTFLPLQESDEQRWISVRSAAPVVTDLPPIDVYKIDDAYFVLDGNHRVSIARQQNIDYLDAYVTEVRTRVPLPPGARPDELIIAAEYAAFLEYTQVDTRRPDVDLQVSAPGQYRHLESHIEAHRYVIETAEEHDLELPEAAGRWYDEVYLPLVEAIREQGILRYFPDRTETDFFIWLARHRAELQNELGLTIKPEDAVTRLAQRLEAPPTSARESLGTRVRRLAQLVVPARSRPRPAPRWSEERTLARYSDHLFARILVPTTAAAAADRSALQVALALAIEEDAHCYALGVAEGDAPPDDARAAFAGVDRSLAAARDELELSAELAVEMGDPVERTLEVAFLSDVIVVPRTFAARPGESAPTGAVAALLERAHRPVFVVGGDCDRPVVQRVLVVHDTRRALDEALFVAAYLAEQWKVALSVLPVAENGDPSRTGPAKTYLTMHEVSADVLPPLRPAELTPDRIAAFAEAQRCDLIVLPGAIQARRAPRGAADHSLALSLAAVWPHSLLYTA